MDLKSCAYAIDVLSRYIELAIAFVIHLNVAIMRHGAYYETYTKILQFVFRTAFYYTVIL